MKKKTLAGILILGQIVLPMPGMFNDAMAGGIAPEIPEEVKTDFEKYCAKPLEEVKAQNLEVSSNSVAGSCAKAEVWRIAYNAESNKFKTFAIAGTTTGAMAVTQFGLKNIGIRAANATASTSATTATTASGTIPALVATACSAQAMQAIPIIGSASAVTIGTAAATSAYTAAETAVNAATAANLALKKAMGEEKAISIMAKTCKGLNGAAIVSKLIWDYNTINKMNETREDFELAKDDLAFSEIFGKTLSTLLPMASMSLMGSGLFGGQAVESAFTTYESTATTSMATATANLTAAAASNTANDTLLTTYRSTHTGNIANPEACSKALLAETAAATAATAAGQAALAIAALLKASTGGRSCMMSSLGMGLMATTSHGEAGKAIAGMREEVANAKANYEASMKSTTQYTNTGIKQNNLSNNAVNNTMNSGQAASEGCSVNPGSIECLSTNDATVSAITNSPDLMGQIAKTHGGKNLGQLMNSTKGMSLADAQNHLANQSSNPSLAKSLTSATGKIVKDPKYASLFKANGFVASQRKSGGKSDDEFDMSKFMNGMIGKMDGGDKKGEAKNDTDYIFRQMELMTPAQIQENKGISLFTRVAYRYRKKNNDLEQMNPTRSSDRELSSEKK